MKQHCDKKGQFETLQDGRESNSLSSVFMRLIREIRGKTFDMPLPNRAQLR